MPATASVTLLNQTNPVYNLFRDPWTDYELLNAGGVRLKNQAQRFLIKRPKELFDVYQERIKRFTYQAILPQIAGWYQGAFFRRNPSLELKDGVDKWYSDQFLNNCDRQGHTYTDFFRDVFRNLLLYKWSWVLTDRPKATTIPQDRAQEKELGLDQPYLVSYRPMDVINWSVDEFGELLWAVLRIETDRPAFLGNVTKTVRWYYFDRTDYEVYEFQVKEKTQTSVTISDPSGNQIDKNETVADLVDSGKHALAKANRVPLRLIEIDDEYWIANRVYLQLLDHLNQDNTLGWALFMANIPMPVFFTERDLGPQTLSETGFLQLGPNDKMEWMEPKGDCFEISAKRLDRLREEIYRTAYLQAQGRDSSATAQGASGYSKEMDMMPANDALNYMGDKIIPAMQNVFKDIVVARGGDEEAITLDVSGFHFETKPATESVSIYQEFLGAGIYEVSPTLERVMIKRLASDSIEDQNEDTKADIMKEIDDSPMSYERDQQEQEQQVQQFQQTFAKVGDKALIKGEEGSLAA